jgi:hypothetical protein
MAPAESAQGLGCDIQFTMTDCVSRVAGLFDLEGYEETVAASLFRGGEIDCANMGQRSARG